MKKIITLSDIRNYLQSEPASKNALDATLASIHSMEPHTAYALLGGHLAPLLTHPKFVQSDSTLDNNRIFLSNQKYMELQSFQKSSEVSNKLVLDFTRAIDKIKNNFQDIKDIINDVSKNANYLVDLLVKIKDEKKSRLTNKNWNYKIGTNASDAHDRKSIFGRFFDSRTNLSKRIKEIKELITKIKANPLSKNTSIITVLEKVVEQLDKIPAASKDWDSKKSTYKGLIWALKGTGWRANWKGDLYWKNNQQKGSESAENPTGLLEMVQDSKKLEDCLGNVNSGINRIDHFYKSKDIHFLKLGALSTEKAYVYLITVLLPFLQNETAETLEKQGQTMKQVSRLYDKWNEIQDEINQLSKHTKIIEKEGIIKDGKFNINLIYDYTDKKGEKWKIVRIKDEKKYLEKLFNAKNIIKKKVQEVKKLLADIEKKLPLASQTLINTMKKLTDKLVLGDPIKEGSYNFYHFPDTDEVRFEVPIHMIPDFTNNNDKDKMNKIIKTYTDEAFGFFMDPDQTKFKAYMDNIAQGITALTSISNMTQQQLQIDTQYYNSLLGFQKSAQDSLNKIVQTAINNTR